MDKKLIGKKIFSQVFLTDPTVVIKNCKTYLPKSNKILEIGVGKSIFSNFLLDFYEDYLGYEIDLELKKYHFLKGKVIYEDFLKSTGSLNFSALVSNLPFKKSMQFLFCCLKKWPKIKRMLVILQKDLVKTFINPKEKNYYFISYFYDIKILEQIPAKAYNPIPNTETVLVLLDKRRDYCQKVLDFLKKLKIKKMLKIEPFKTLRLPELDKKQLQQLFSTIKRRS